MFSIRAYCETPSIEILCDGPNLPQGMPAAIRMEEGLAFIDRAPEGQKNTLTSPEATALALTSVGMGNSAISQRLSHWYGRKQATAMDSLYDKLDENRWGTREAMVASAFQRGFLIAESPPQLWIGPDLRQEFFNMTALLSTDHSPKEIAELRSMPLDEVRSTLARIAIDTDFEFMEHPATAFVTLAGMARLLPTRHDIPLSDLTPPMTGAHELLFPTQELYFQPFGQENPDTQVRFDNQPINLEEPDVSQGAANRILMEGAVIDINNGPFVASNGETMNLAPAEVSFLALRSVGVPEKEACKLLGLNAYGVLGLYNKLLPPCEAKQRMRALEQSMLAAFEKGIFVARKAPDMYLDRHWRQRFQKITALAAAGKTGDEIAAELEVAPSTIPFNSGRLQRMLNVRGMPSLVLLSLAKRFHGWETPASTSAAAA